MKIFLGDECLLFLKKQSYRKAIEEKGWELVVIGDNGCPDLSTSDENIYNWMADNEIDKIITSNVKHFVDLEKLNRKGIAILDLQEKVAATLIIKAIEEAISQITLN